jgi:hypothetical protein
MRARQKLSTPLKLVAAAPRIAGHVVGQIVGWTEQGLLVIHPHAEGPTLARSVVAISAAVNAQIGKATVEALLVFEEESSERPIVVGLLVSSQPETESAAQPYTAESVHGVDPCRAEAYVDGKRVVLEGQDEVVLRCGMASITLRRNGRVVIRGTYVETRAEGVNRIQGGSVQIN